MKKFSNITKQKVNEEPKTKEVKVLNEEEIFKSKLIDLMDNILTIRTYGPVDRYQRAGSIKIGGKEMLVEAILDLLSDNNKKEGTKLLEGLKSEIGDWNVIDSKIEELNSESPHFKNKVKFKSMLESYEGESLLIKVQKDIDKISNKKTLKDYIELTKESNLSGDLKDKLINLYLTRSNLIG
jgi:hypothetical protein